LLRLAHGGNATSGSRINQHAYKQVLVILDAWNLERVFIAFVDIAMPFMDGIEFTQIATARYPNLIIIIMTAFDQFEYARKCVSLPVFDYMLKPMVRAEVTKVLERAKEKLDASRHNQGQRSNPDKDGENDDYDEKS